MVEDDPEYQLIVKANTITVAIDNEVLVVHKVNNTYIAMFCFVGFKLLLFVANILYQKVLTLSVHRLFSNIFY